MTDLLEKQDNISYHAGEEDIRAFLSEIREVPRLSMEEERELARRCAAGDEDAIRQMVNANLRLVVSMAREYAGRGVPMLDLIQEGSIGLIAAARKFDYTLDYRFSTYATKWIRQGITRSLMNHSCPIRVPVHTAERIRKIQAAAAQYRQETGQEPAVSYLAGKTGMTQEKVREYLLLDPEVCSLDIPTGEEDSGTLGALVADLQTPQPQEAMVRLELENMLKKLMESLNERQQLILRRHFGLEDGICVSLEEISKELNISKERVRQIEQQAMEKMQKMGAEFGLEDFLE